MFACAALSVCVCVYAGFLWVLVDLGAVGATIPPVIK